MIITDIHGHKIEWSDKEFTPIRLQLAIARKYDKKDDPLRLFMSKITYDSFKKDCQKITIKEIKKLKCRLNGIVRKWKQSRIRQQIKEFIELLERCINNRRCLYVFTNPEILRLAS